MKKSSAEIAQLCLNSIEGVRSHLDRDVVIELATIAHDQSFSAPKRALMIAECALAVAKIVDDIQAKAWAIWAKWSVHRQWLPSDLDRDLVIALATIAHNQSFSAPKRALIIAECALAAEKTVNDMLARAWAIWAQGVAFSSTHHPHEALPCYREAEAIFIRHQQWPYLVEVQVALVYVLKECGRPKAAHRLAEQVRPRCHDLGEEGLLSLGLLEMNVGSMYRQQGKLDLALKAYKKAMLVYEHIEDPFRIARVKINSANVYLQKDQYQQAESLYYEARELLQQVMPPPQELPLVDINLGLLAEKLGHYQKALHHLEHAHDGFISEALIASANMKRAAIYNRLNLNQESLALAQSVAHYYAEAEQFVFLAQALYSQGVAWQKLSKLEKKHNYLERARDCFLEARQLFVEQNIRQEIVLIDLMLAELALESHDIEQARKIASSLADRIDGDLWPNLTVQAYLLQARILLWDGTQGESPNETALHYTDIVLQQALHLTGQHPQPKLMVDTYHLLSQFYAIQGDPKTAWVALCQAMIHLERMRASLLLDEFRVCLLDDLHGVYEDGLRLLQTAIPFDAISDKQIQRAAMFYLLNVATTAPLIQMGAETTLKPDINEKLDKNLQDLRREWHWHQSKLKEIEDKLTKVRCSPDIRDREVYLKNLEQEIAKIGSEMTQIERPIADLVRRLGTRTGWKGVTVSLTPEQSGSEKMSDDTLDAQFQEQSTYFCNDIQQKLAEYEALLQYFIVDRQVYLLLVNHTEIDYYSLGSVGSIDRFKFDWESHFEKIKMYCRVPRSANNILSELGEVLLDPLLEKLTDIVHLYLVYPAEWHEIPFAALRTTQGYLVEHFQLTHLSTPEALLQVTSVDSASDIQPHALIVGCSDNKRLPHSIHESHQIQKTLSCSGWQTTLLLEGEATRKNFDKAVSKSRLLHLATHAHSQPENPLFSWILLEDGPLTVADIYHQTPLLNQAVVVLSACQTGRGQARGGSLLGMARAWLVSGARSLVASLWEVEDQATAQLMEYFYGQIDNPHTHITSHHLCQAQRRLAKTRHPFFWAAFIYIGG